MLDSEMAGGAALEVLATERWTHGDGRSTTIQRVSCHGRIVWLYDRNAVSAHEIAVSYLRRYGWRPTIEVAI